MTFTPTMNDKSAASINVAWLEYCFSQGIVPELGRGTLYINRAVRTKPVIGCGRIETKGCAAPSIYLPAGDHPTLTGNICRIVQLSRTPAFILSGTQFIINGALEIVGDLSQPAIIVEGRSSPPTGRHIFRDVVFTNWDYPVQCLDGYYTDKRDFVKDENHADNGVFENCETFNCNGFFQSLSEQAVQWRATGCKVNGTTRTHDFILANLYRGGCITFRDLTIEESRVWLAQVNNYSPNNCQLTFDNVYLDRMLDPGYYLGVLKYVGKPENANFSKWSVDAKIYAACYLDKSKMISAPADLPRDLINIDLRQIYTS